MQLQPFQELACPLDGQALRAVSNGTATAWCCGQGHGFDAAGLGYVNLLPVQQKRSRDPGDSKAMVAARCRFLQAGHYQPIAAAVASLALADRSADADLACLDAGCGEGYYLRQLAQAAAAAGPGQLALLGLDISKWAVQAAARQGRGLAWVVGTNANLPVLSGTLDRLLCLFGFPVAAEFSRVLKPGGRLILVDAGPEHLQELRQIIYPQLKEARRTTAPLPGFRLLQEEVLAIRVHLQTQADIHDLLAMTPHLYRASASGRAAALALTALSLQVQVTLRVLERSPDRGH